jgi:hypothetical protein
VSCFPMFFKSFCVSLLFHIFYCEVVTFADFVKFSTIFLNLAYLQEA